jgi:hypothetical protein
MTTEIVDRAHHIRLLGVFFTTADPSSRTVQGVGLGLLACWGCGIKFRGGLGCLFERCVLSGRGLCVGLIIAQRTPTECGVSVTVKSCWNGPSSLAVAAPWEESFITAKCSYAEKMRIIFSYVVKFAPWIWFAGSSSRVDFIISGLVCCLWRTPPPGTCFHNLRITSLTCHKTLDGGAPFCRHRRGRQLYSAKRSRTVQLNVSSYELAKTKQMETAGSAWRLFQYQRLLDKTSRDIFLAIWKRLRRQKIVICLFHDLSGNLGGGTLVCMRRLFRQHCRSWVLDICRAVWTGELLLAYPAPLRLSLVIGVVLNTVCPGYRCTKIHAYVLVPKSFMKFMFSTVYRVTQKDFYAHPYTSVWAPVVAPPHFRRDVNHISGWDFSWTLGRKRRSYCLAPKISGFDTIRHFCIEVY